MFSCCGKNARSLCEQLECRVTETKSGVQVEITAKDASKAEPLKAMVKAVRDLVGCC